MYNDSVNEPALQQSVEGCRGAILRRTRERQRRRLHHPVVLLIWHWCTAHCTDHCMMTGAPGAAVTLLRTPDRNHILTTPASDAQGRQVIHVVPLYPRICHKLPGELGMWLVAHAQHVQRGC